MTLLWRIAAELFAGVAVVLVVVDGQEVVAVQVEPEAATSASPAHRVPSRCRGPPRDQLSALSVTLRACAGNPPNQAHRQPWADHVATGGQF